jgi:hypothetical protein
MSAPPNVPKTPAPAPGPTGSPAPQAAAAPRPLGHEKNSAVVWDIVRRRPKPLMSVAFTMPVFLLYHLGILAVDRHSQVDFVSTLVLRVLEASTPAYVLMTLALALALLLTTWVQMKRGKVLEHSFGRVLAESMAAALGGLMAIGWATHEMRGSEASISALSVFEKIVLAAGSGFHEEFLFRALLVTGAAWAVTKLTKWKPMVSLLVCVIGSSVLFSLAHYFVIFDEPFVAMVAGYRVLEGLLFATLYVTRGFAVAVYAHAFYDLMAFYMYS